MSFNQASELVKQYQGKYDCCKTGSIGVGNDIRNPEAFLKDIQADPEKLKDFEGGLNAFGASVKQAQEKLKAFKTIQAAIDLVYPPPEPEPIIQVTDA